MFAFALRLLSFPALVMLLCLTPDAHGEQTWTEIRSPHFRVLTDASGKDGRKVAHEFEQMRYVFALRFNNARIEMGAPLTIIAARDGSTFHTLEPAIWKAQGDRIAGLFHRGWEKQFAIVRLDSWGDNGQVVVYHEYTHSILHANTLWLPVWLDEGMAEFYAYTRFQGDRIYVGAPSQRMGQLLHHTLLPVATMLDINRRSPYYHDEDKVQLFYAESWAMVHFMTFGPGMNGGDKLNAFIKLLSAKVPQQKAFHDVFGDPLAFDQAFAQYFTRFTMTAGVLPPDHGPDPASFAERKLTPAEADYELGCFEIGTHNRVAGRALLEESVAFDAKLAGAHEELGFLDFDKGDDVSAQQEWKQALALDPDQPRALFALTMSGAAISAQSPDQLRITQHTLQHVTELAPRFAPAFVELALIECRQNSVQQAYKDAYQAETLEPWRAGYRLLMAHILLQGHQPALAASYSRYVAGQWFGPDHNEAVDLWKAVPAAQQGDGPPLVLDVPAGTELARGTITSTTCNSDGKAGHLSVSLAPESPAGAAPLSFSSEKSLSSGFSDTLWWGEDHFSLCHHLAGLAALVAYKPHGAEGGELLSFEIRDILPDAKGGPAVSVMEAAGATLPSATP